MRRREFIGSAIAGGLVVSGISPDVSAVEVNQTMKDIKRWRRNYEKQMLLAAIIKIRHEHDKYLTGWALSDNPYYSFDDLYDEFRSEYARCSVSDDRVVTFDKVIALHQSYTFPENNNVYGNTYMYVPSLGFEVTGWYKDDDGEFITTHEYIKQRRKTNIIESNGFQKKRIEDINAIHNNEYMQEAFKHFKTHMKRVKQMHPKSINSLMLRHNRRVMTPAYKSPKFIVKQ